MGERAYLRADARRRQLLDAASRLFEQDGFTAITMSAVAAEAGASRRLVYDHFSDLGDLYAAFFEDRVARYAAAIDHASAPGSAGGPRSFEGAAGELLAVPAQDLRAIQLVLADSAAAELAGARAALRDHLRSRWLPVLEPMGIAQDTADALLWSLASSFVTVADHVQRGALAPEAGLELAAALAASLPHTVERLSRTPAHASEAP